MFRTIWSKTLRDYRVAILCWSLFLGLYILAVYAVYGQDSSSATTYEQLAQSFRFFGDPVAIDTPNGFTTWRALGPIAVLLSIWTLLAGSAMLRREEERFSLDLLLSTPHSRVRFLLEKLFALMLSLLIIALFLALGAMAGQASAKLDVEVGRALLMGLNIALVAFFFATLALFLSQLFASRSAASGLVGVILALAYLLDGIGRSVQNGEWIQRLSPLYYYNQNKPLIPTYESHLYAPLLLLGCSLLFIIVSLFLFTRRDVGGVALPASLWRVQSANPAQRERTLTRAFRDLFGRSIGLRAGRDQLLPAFWWIVAIAVFAGMMTAITNGMLGLMRDLSQGNPVLGQIFSGDDLATNAGLLSAIVFQLGAVLVSCFSLVLSLKWANDLDAGRLELPLSTPHTRLRFVVERFTTLLLFMLLTPLILWLTILITANVTSLNVDANKAALASLGFLPLELIVVTAIFLLAMRVRSSIIAAVVGAYLALSFLAEYFKTLFDLPNWLINLSLIHLYGQPLVDGISWGPFFALLGIAALMLIIGAFQFSIADVERGS